MEFDKERIPMIVKLKELHREELLEFLKRDEDYNLYMIGDIENYGFDKDYQDVWGTFRDGVLTSVLLRYYIFFMYYSPCDENVNGYIEVMKRYNTDFRQVFNSGN